MLLSKGGNSMKRRKTEKLPGTDHVHVQLPIPLCEKMRNIQDARRITEGSETKLSKLYAEALGLYLRTIDFVTGLPKRRSAKPLSLKFSPK
jgi:hypothetical protein